MRKHNINNINLQIHDVKVCSKSITEDGEFVHNGCIRIQWNSDIGFGEYDLCKDENGDWIGHSETMDSNDDKDFIKKLLEVFVEKLTVL